MRTALHDVLLAERYRILTAADGEIGLRRAIEEKPDLILLDIMMPGVDGLETCRLLKQEPATRDIPVIFITAFPERLLTGERPEPTFLVTKPFNPDMVKALISQALFFNETTRAAA